MLKRILRWVPVVGIYIDMSMERWDSYLGNTKSEFQQKIWIWFIYQMVSSAIAYLVIYGFVA